LSLILPFQIVDKIREQLQQAKQILLLTHHNPDGDALGSMTGLNLALLGLDKKVTMACLDEAPPRYQFLPRVNEIKQDFNLAQFDLVIMLDCGGSYMSGFQEKYPELVDLAKTNLLNIDHHPSNNNFGRVNLVLFEAPATTFIIFQLLKKLKLKINSPMATALLAGLYSDTGSFMHSNTNSETCLVAAELLKLGANRGVIVKNFFHTTPISSLRLWGRVLRNLKRTNSSVTVGIAKKEDFEKTGAEYPELSGVIDYIASVAKSKFSLLLAEKDGDVKGSLRTRQSGIDVAKIAEQFGGGGHTQAAGFTLPGEIKEENRWKIISSEKDHPETPMTF